MKTVSVGLVKTFMMPASEKGVSKSQLLKAVDLRESDLENDEKRLPCIVLSKMLKAATDLSGDENFPLYSGQQAQAADFSVLGHLIYNSPTIRDAYKIGFRYGHALGEGLEFDYTEDQDYARIIIRIADPAVLDYRRYVMDNFTAKLVASVRLLLQKKANPVAVHLGHPAPASTAAHEDFFQCDLHFNAEYDQVIWDKAIVDEPILTANPALFQVFEKFVEDIVARIDQDEPLSRRVSRLILAQLKDNEATIDAVSAKMAMGVRTLQRKLRLEGSSFKELLANVRKEIAIYHLSRNILSITQISYALGFSEPSVFHRSFKKWVGITPADYRRRKRDVSFINPAANRTISP